MKTLKILSFTLLLLISTASFAQYGNDYYNPYSVTRFGGVDRSIGRDYSSRGKKPTAEELEKDRNERIDKFMTKLKAELTLDDLQAIAIKNELVTNGRNVEIVMKKEDDKASKSEQVKALTDKTEVVIKSYLNKSQKEKYDIFMENLKNGKSDKMNKKGKKEDLEKTPEDPQKTTDDKITQ